jgi:hypothetical protein
MDAIHILNVQRFPVDVVQWVDSLMLLLDNFHLVEQ